MTSRQDGFVTVALAGLVLVLMAVSGVVAALAGVAVARHRAAAAADLGALAAAGRAHEGAQVACAAAGAVASAQGAALKACRLEGLDAFVEVTVSAPGWLGDLGRARGLAAAGPDR